MRRVGIRYARAALILLPAMLLAYAVIVSVLIAFPRQSAVRSSDAVVSLGPASDRLPLAQQLFESGRADSLVISWAGPMPRDAEENAPDEPLDQRLCSSGDPRIYCFVPSPSDTLGEATRVRQLAVEEGWKSITVVTSRYHAFRAEFIFARVMPQDVEVQVVHAETELGVRGWLYHLAYEHVAFIKAVFETALR
ncbi:YdcF family protein [Leucobacter sp. wl10]|uniref:YdcF family protein n=1 Tax=Leucobacter sp. wl10 TaxID=2304677 RepID=UPI000E5A51A7|nr:YdcF family protein [Leucobacter sp. wl10]RGE19789.1 YdcF family protein [Leucobacter sp. wl10]